jgi:hypothetical protein
MALAQELFSDLRGGVEHPYALLRLAASLHVREPHHRTLGGVVALVDL